MPKVQSKTAYSAQPTMEIEEILHLIFGPEFSHQQTEARDFQYALYFESIASWIARTLNDLVVIEQAIVGKIGPPLVHFDVRNHTGLFMVGKDRLSASSQCNFGTIRGNTCVYKGKWQYELNLSSNGVMQLGWATINCKFSQEKGVGKWCVSTKIHAMHTWKEFGEHPTWKVEKCMKQFLGDTPNSYSYDGNRVRKWNVSTEDYGQPWHCGDVIGSAIDLDAGTVEFYRQDHTLY